MVLWKRIWRFLGLAIAALGLALTLNNCSASPPSNAPSSPAAEASPTSHAGSGHGRTAKLININTAILSELDKLEALLGVPSLSHQIQSSRPYASVDDLVSKNVLKPEQLAKVRDLLTTQDIVLSGRAKDVDYLVKLGLMKGHLLVAQELLDRQLPKKAEPHIGHPIEEIYVDISDQLTERQGPTDLKDLLLRLQDLVKSKPNDPELKTTLAKSLAAIDQAISVLPATERQSPGFVLEAIDGLLDTAASEYGAAISNGRFAAEIEYQDSRGFVQYAKDGLLPSIAPALTTKDAALAKDLTAKLDTLYKAWPDPVPPAAPIVTSDALTAQIKAIQKASAPIVQADSQS